MDANTATGMTPEKCARYILDALLDDAKDIMLCDWQAQFAYVLRFLCPRVYFWIMEKRSAKFVTQQEREQQEKQENKSK